MIHTIIHIIVYQLLFLAVYDLFLKKETFFNLNRIYLLVTPILSIVLPFVSLGFIQQNIPQEYFVQLPAVVLEGNVSGLEKRFPWLLLILILWIMGIVGSALLFSYKIFKLIKLNRSGTVENVSGITLRTLPKTDLAFSFHNTIYLGDSISKENRASIIAHEKVHIYQKHSWDLLYFELLRIVFWFNPFVYLFQNRISTLHEYIADTKVAHQNKKREYYQNLLSEVFQTDQISFVNTFFKQSLIKKRIVMLQKTRSPRIKMMKYLLLLPILASILIYTSCSGTKDITQNKEKVINQMPTPPVPPAPPTPPVANREVVEITEVREMDENEVSDVPFSVIDQVPIYPGCTGDNIAMKKCMSTKISEFINSNFNIKVADTSVTGRQRISVQFKINNTGKVVDIRARTKNPKLQAEAERVIAMLPQMSPGEQRGEKVGVLYSLPIIIDLK
ncbi:M56 family metallopeptidase [Aequorivita sp. H23M31]|uniref:M56 family metallopeptidase n=1 Tax=Aequorivita ciconiae TaxID=2494375 RepID=A0A410G5R2_9FLAO|nr:M56 family metallopeptidase [Aequorivita sp. H23M31]QAA82617.1 M56 family metallopeptidase [Aequorivita sp. H23M31]